MELRQDAAWAMIVPTSMGVRITPENGQPVHSSRTYTMHATSAETNVASIASHLGLPVKVLTAFVEGSPIAQIIKSDLAARHMSYEGPEVPQGGAWGYRHQFNIADSGVGNRGPRVHNDRAGEVGRTLNVKDFDLDRIFGTEGVQILHLSGLIAALSPEASTFCLELARAAKRHGTRISFDINYRASFWKGREKELAPSSPRSPACPTSWSATRRTSSSAWESRAPRRAGRTERRKIESFKGMIERVKKAYPKTSCLATTLREVPSANRHLWGAHRADGQRHVVEPRDIPVLDRIGGDEAFVGGLLYAILKGWAPEQWIQFGWASGALATTLLTDYAQIPADEDEVWSIWKGNARVRR